MRRWIVFGLAAFVIALAVAASLSFPRPVGPGPSTAPSTFEGAYRRGTCATTAEVTWGWAFRQNGRLFAGPPRSMVVGGRLATQPTRNLLVGTAWWVAAAPRDVIHLRATRLDRDAPPIEFAAVGYPLSEILDDPWDRGWHYRTSVSAVDAFPTAAGCWKVQWVDGVDTDVVVLELRGPGQK